MVDEWLEALKEFETNPDRADELKKAMNAAMDAILEHRRQHGC